MDQLIPADSTQDDTIQHNNMRRLAAQPIDTDDRAFTQDEVKQKASSLRKRQARTELREKF